VNLTIDFIKYVSIVFIGLLPIMNPLTTFPLYMALTKRMSVENKRKQAVKACIYAFSILTAFLLLGRGSSRCSISRFRASGSQAASSS